MEKRMTDQFDIAKNTKDKQQNIELGTKASSTVFDFPVRPEKPTIKDETMQGMVYWPRVHLTRGRLRQTAVKKIYPLVLQVFQVHLALSRRFRSLVTIVSKLSRKGLMQSHLSQLLYHPVRTLTSSPWTPSSRSIPRCPS